MIKLNLGSGGDYIEGFVNVDMYADRADERFDISLLPYADNFVDEIRAYHVIEHFDYKKMHDVLKEWNRVLKPKGKIRIETPDFYASCKEFINTPESERFKLYGHFFSMPWVNDGLTHKFLFTEDQLISTMRWAGFKNVFRTMPDSSYVNDNNKHIFLNVEATK